MGLWARAYWYPVGVSTQVGPWRHCVTNCHGQTWYQSQWWFLDIMWLTCEGECWKYFTCEEDPTSLKEWIVNLYIIHDGESTNTIRFWKRVKLIMCCMQVKAHELWICELEPTGAT